MTRRDAIVNALLSPYTLSQLSMAEWDVVVREGRRSVLLARLAHTLQQENLLESVPQAARHHLRSALQMAVRQDMAVHWEVECIRTALRDAGVKVILLKGAAYAMAGLGAAHGRTFSDVDIIVPKERLSDTESELMIHGWQGAHHDAYDQRFYREWMHEIPPMRHVRRGTTIDVHHTILPETSRVKVNTPALMEAEGLVPLPGHENVYIFRPTDMLLHSATHLFHEGDFDKGLRELFDLDSLLRQFGAEPAFWDQLVPRAITLGLTRPLFYALRYTTIILETPVPASVMDAARIGKPFFLLEKLMDICFLRVLRCPRPQHSTEAIIGRGAAHFALYVRSHWIRMPFSLLTVHLGRKAFMRLWPPAEPKPDGDAI